MAFTLVKNADSRWNARHFWTTGLHSWNAPLAEKRDRCFVSLSRMKTTFVHCQMNSFRLYCNSWVNTFCQVDWRKRFYLILFLFSGREPYYLWLLHDFPMGFFLLLSNLYFIPPTFPSRHTFYDDIPLCFFPFSFCVCFLFILFYPGSYRFLEMPEGAVRGTRKTSEKGSRKRRL